MRSLIPHNPLHTGANVNLLMLLKIKVVTRVLSGCSHKMLSSQTQGVQLHADLMDMSSHSRHIDNVKFLLTVVDAFSRLAWVKLLQSKRGEEVRDKLKRVIDNNNYRCTFRLTRVLSFVILMCSVYLRKKGWIGFPLRMK